MNPEEKTHSCEENTYGDVAIRFQPINISEWAWVCEQSWQESELEVEEGMSDTTDNTMSFHIFLIDFCPFCGEQLRTE